MPTARRVASVLTSLPTIINNWRDLNMAQEVFRAAEENEEWVFRGVPGKFSLSTSLDRVAEEFGVEPTKKPDLEVQLIFEFMRRYHLYGLEPPPKKGDTLDWLSLMRHHGAPARLLDFTYSFPVAAFFALETKSSTGVPEIWALNRSWLARAVPRMLRRFQRTDGSRFKGVTKQFALYAGKRDGNAWREVFLKARPLLVYPVSAFRLNQRITIQQGHFVAPGDVTHTFEENLHAMPDWKDNVRSIPIKPDARPELLATLSRVNLNRATLYPGLDGFAGSLWTRVASLMRLKSMEDRGARSKINLNIDALREW